MYVGGEDQEVQKWRACPPLFDAIENHIHCIDDYYQSTACNSFVVRISRGSVFISEIWLVTSLFPPTTITKSRVKTILIGHTHHA